MPHGRNSSHPLFLGLVAAFALLASAPNADEIRLKGGGTIEGKVLKVGPDKVTIQRGRSTMTLARSQVIAPDLADLLTRAKAAAEGGDFASAIGLCEQILLWETGHSEAATLLAKSKEQETKAEAQAKALEQKRKMEQEQREKERIAEAAQKEKIERARGLLGKRNWSDARALCREVLAEVPQNTEANRLLTEVDAAEGKIQEQAREKAAREGRLRSPEYLKEVLAEIEKKLADVKTISYLGQASAKTPQGETAYNEEVCIQRPDRYHLRMTEGKAPEPGADRRSRLTVCDGATYWTLANLGWGPARLAKYDLVRLRAAGGSLSDVDYSFSPLEPFRNCVKETLRLETEDASVWVFAGTMREGDSETSEFRITIGRNDGVMRKVEGVGKDGQLVMSETLSNVRLYPTLPEGFFSFTPPADVEIKDLTDLTIQHLQRRGEKPPPQP